MMKIDNERKMFTSNLNLQSLKIKAFRKLLIGMAESRMEKYIAASDYPFLPEMVSHKAFTAFKNLLQSIESNYEKGNISFGYIKKFIRTLALSSHTLPNESLSFKVRYGFDPPMFVLLSPTAVCNLNCVGCYADCDQKKRATLDFDICKRILKEKQASWGSYFTVISGGEPFMYHDNGKTIFDLFEAFPDNLFLSDFDRFCEYYMDEQGAVFAWLFQYMPIGRDHDSFALLVPPEKRKALWEKYLVHERKKLKN
jgi:hypothetical protein